MSAEDHVISPPSARWPANFPTERLPASDATWDLPLVDDLRPWELNKRPHASAFVAGHDAPLIGERAATRGRGATGGGDERARLPSVCAPASRTGSNGRNVEEVGGHSNEWMNARPPSSPTTMRRSSANARYARAHRNGTGDEHADVKGAIRSRSNFTAVGRAALPEEAE
jgi:hypothetical protein